MREFILFARHLIRMIVFVRGVFLVLLLVLLGFALAISWLDEIPYLDALYLTFVTALTIGYGDITPTTNVARVVGVFSGLVGVIFVGLIVAISTRALENAVREEAQYLRDNRSSDDKR